MPECPILRSWAEHELVMSRGAAGKLCFITVVAGIPQVTRTVLVDKRELLAPLINAMGSSVKAKMVLREQTN